MDLPASKNGDGIGGEGNSAEFTVNGTTFTVRLPAEGAGSVGIAVADPCFSSRNIPCFYGDKLQTFARLSALLNAAASPKASLGGASGLDYWMVLGDNFYDKDGSLSRQFFDVLSLDIKATPFASTPGNHDFWMLGSPIFEQGSDQYINGFLQFYPQDTLASVETNHTAPGGFLDLSVDPDKAGRGHRLPSAANGFWYNKIGDVGVCGLCGRVHLRRGETLPRAGV